MVKNVKRFIIPVIVVCLFLSFSVVIYARNASSSTPNITINLASNPISNTNSTTAVATATTRNGTARSLRSRVGWGPSPSFGTWASVGGTSMPLRNGATVSQRAITNNSLITGQGQRVQMGQSTWDTRETANVSFNWR